MEDPIIKRLKEEGRIGVKVSSVRVGPNFDTERKSGSLQRLYRAGNPIITMHPEQVNTGRPELRDLEQAVGKVNHGQKQLEVIKKLESSELYKFGMEVYDGILGLFGMRPSRYEDVYALLEHQQQNIRQLNFLLADMLRSYDENVKTTRQDLDGLLLTTQKEIERSKALKQDEIPPELVRYDEAVNSFKGADIYKNPHEYFRALQEVIDSKRSSRQKRFEFITAAMGHEHHSLQIDKLMMQEELFETMLYRIMEMAFKTELYQETIDRDLPIWRSTRDLFEATKAVSGSMLILEGYTKDLNSIFTKAVGEIVGMADNHQGARLMEGTNQDLRRLITDVNASFYRDVSSYDFTPKKE
ncbi:hypothetical protein HY638_05405 [Candidatus Woesearchaeota archaeon]|nr:hypothetical protein [Candidatus Woesearchaeota archaeon]